MNTVTNIVMNTDMKPDQLKFDYSIYWSLLVLLRVWVLVTGLVGKLFDNLKSYPVHNQIHGLVPIKLYALVKNLNASSQGSDSKLNI